MFFNFKNVLDSTRVKVPFGIAQVGRSFRNEVTPRNFIFRSREFEQMELEFFVHPNEATKWYEFWRKTRFDWWQSLGLAGENLRLRDHEQDELAHYAKDAGGCADVEYAFPFSGAKGFGELEGIAYRSDYDLRQHQKVSGAKLEYFDQEKNERYLPHVIEPAAGLTRGLLAVLCEAYTVDESRPSPELMRFHPRLAPIKAGVFPLVNKEGMPEIAEPEPIIPDTLGDRYERVMCKLAPQIAAEQRAATTSTAVPPTNEELRKEIEFLEARLRLLRDKLDSQSERAGSLSEPLPLPLPAPLPPPIEPR